MSEIQLVQHAAARLQETFGSAPAAAIILGSGGGPLVKRWPLVGQGVPYPALALPQTTVAGHSGQVCVAEIAGQRVALLSGRVHGYEGRGANEQLRAVRAMAAWGIPRVIMTSAVGSLRIDRPPGSLVRVTDHINLSGNPLVGPNEPGIGTRFPDLAAAYSPALGALFDSVAVDCGVETYTGVYASVSGPSYETPAEVRMLGMMGGDVVGMSLGPEVTGAVHAGLEVLAVSVVSNLAAGLATEVLRHDEVLEVVGAANHALGTLIEAVVARW